MRYSEKKLKSMIFIYFLIAGSACSLCWAIVDIYRTLKYHGGSHNEPYPPSTGAGVRLPNKPPPGSGTAFATPEVEGNPVSRIP
jgi:hypothetical protein